jgi:hypothetical protein
MIFTIILILIAITTLRQVQLTMMSSMNMKSTQGIITMEVTATIEMTEIAGIIILVVFVDLISLIGVLDIMILCIQMFIIMMDIILTMTHFSQDHLFT